MNILNTIYAFGKKIKSSIRSRQVPVWTGLISIVLSVDNLGPNIYYGIDRIPVWVCGVVCTICTVVYFVISRNFNICLKVTT